MFAVLAVFFQRTRIGRALRAVADDHQAALSVGISLETIWVVVWFAAGVVALIDRHHVGGALRRSFALQIVALKALPVLILGGLTSVPGAIVGGLIIGIGEKLGEVLLGPAGRRRDRGLARLRHRAGLPPRPPAGPVRRADHRARLMLYRETGQYRTSYAADAAIFPLRQDRIGLAVAPLPGAGPYPAPRQRLPDQHGHDPVPDLDARHHRPQPADRLRRPPLARHRRLHGGGRLRLLQAHHPAAGRQHPRC